jgi:hypothetical protein
MDDIDDSVFKNQLLRKEHLRKENKIIGKRIACLKAEQVGVSRKIQIFRKTGEGMTHEDFKNNNELRDKLSVLEDTFYGNESDIREIEELIAFYGEDLEQDESKLELKKNDITSREKNTLLRIIAVMAKKYYGSDLSEPHVVADKIAKDAELQGIDLKSKTVAEKLKEAKRLFLD